MYIYFVHLLVRIIKLLFLNFRWLTFDLTGFVRADGPFVFEMLTYQIHALQTH